MPPATWLVAPEPQPGLEAPGASRRRHTGALLGLRLGDALLPCALLLWLVAVDRIDPAAMNDFGLFPALPVVFFAAVALLLASIVVLLSAARLSPVRLALHLVALMMILHGTVPLVLPAPMYPWVYKHMGVVGYINMHGTLDVHVDIYQNWPGFFALGAWFTKVAGFGSPLVYAAWAPVYFNVLSCLGLWLVFRSLPLTRRIRWIALFLFVAGNWIGQDYFAPQALAFVLSLAVYGMVLAWLKADRPPALLRAGRRLAWWALRARRGPNAVVGSGEDSPGSASTPPATTPGLRAARLVCLLGVFGVIVVTHQLTPFVVVIGVGLLTLAGLVRPRWVVVAMAAMTLGYMTAHMSFLDRTQDLLGSLGNLFGNVNGNGVGGTQAQRGRALMALGAPLLILEMFALAGWGALRRLRSKRPTLALLVLAGAPALIAFGQSYGGEVIFRIYLFALPWIVALAASALERGVHRRWLGVASVAIAVPVAVGLMMSATFGATELYEVRPASVRASQFFYDHAEPGSLLAFVGPGFPVRVGARYDRFVVPPSDSKPNLLTTGEGFKHRHLGPADLPSISTFMDDQLGDSGVAGYLALSREQAVNAEVLGFLPKGAVADLNRALAESPAWRLFYRDGDAAIYRFVGGSVVAPPPDEPQSPAAEEPAEPLVPVTDPATPTELTWTAQAGDSLWSGAAAALSQAWGTTPTDAEVAGYWVDLIAANQSHLADPAQPDLIFAGQVFVLPPP